MKRYGIRILTSSFLTKLGKHLLQAQWNKAEQHLTSLLHQENQHHSLTSAPAKSFTGNEISWNESKTGHQGYAILYDS